MSNISKQQFINNFNYYKTPKIHPLEEDTIKLLTSQIQNSEFKPIDIINYEELIFLEVYFKDNNKIQNLISQLKSIIFQNYRFKQQFIYKITNE